MNNWANLCELFVHFSEEKLSQCYKEKGTDQTVQLRFLLKLQEIQKTKEMYFINKLLALKPNM